MKKTLATIGISIAILALFPSASTADEFSKYICLTKKNLVFVKSIFKTMKKVIALVSGVTFLLQALSTTAAPSQQPKAKTFAQWCQQRNSVPASTKLTIDLLLKQAGTKNCKQADAKLNSLTSIELYTVKSAIYSLYPV